MTWDFGAEICLHLSVSCGGPCHEPPTPQEACALRAFSTLAQTGHRSLRAVQVAHPAMLGAPQRCS